MKQTTNETEKYWETFGEASKKEILELSDIPAKYHEGLIYSETLNPYFQKEFSVAVKKYLKKRDN